MIKIDKEFEKLIPALTGEEFATLEKNIIADGCRDALVTWQGTLIDGHNRYAICSENNIAYNTIEKKFDNRYEAINWMLNNQIGRRNITPDQRSYLRGKRYENEKLQHGGERASGQNVHLIKTSEKVAFEVGVNERTIRRDEQFAKAIDSIAEKTSEAIKREILSNNIKVTKNEAEKISKLSKEQLTNVIETAKAKTDAGEHYKSLTSIIKEVEKNIIIEDRKTKSNKTTNKKVKIYNADCLEVLKSLENKSIDCVLIDPPYAIDFNHSWQGATIKNDTTETALLLLDDVCKLLIEKAKQDAHIYIFSSWLNIDKFKQIIEKYFDLSNILVWVKNNSSLVDFNKRYAFKYENIFFCKQKGNNERMLNNKQSPDVLNFNRVSIPYHPTEKPVDLLKYIIENSTVENEIVLDCFMGSGSTGVASLELNRKFIGIEIDKKYYDYASTRLER